MAETRKEANAAFDFFVETYGIKYEKAVARLVKDRDGLLAFHDFRAEHWKHIRTTNPIKSVFATVRNRTRKNQGLPQPKNRACNGLPTVDVSQKEVAEDLRDKPSARGHSRG